MRRPSFVLLLPAVAVLLGAAGADAQQVAPTSTVSSTVAQQWSSRIVSSDEIDSTIPGAVPGASSTTTKPTVKKAKARSAATTTTVVALATAVAPAGSGDGEIAPEVWLALRKCESGNRYDLSTGNGYYGAYQFALGTWQKLGYPGYPHQAPPAVQDEAARRLQAKSGWGVWPSCSRKIGVR